MRLLLLLGFLGGIAGNLFAQTYLHPTVGVNSTYAGACLVNTCSGTYYDNGGSGSNYSNNINAVYRTFCPNTAGNCVRATFSSFSMNDTYFLCGGPNSCCDYMTIYNGAVPNTPVLYNNCTTSPGTITASSANGCLTFRMVSDGSVTLAGWAATLSCVPCAGGPIAGAQTDCVNSVQICSNSPISYNSPGPGLVSESCSGCSSAEGEIHSAWYVFQVSSGGNLGLTIVPNIATDDFDFVLYGPGVTCSALGTPIRCSYAATAGNTGMGNGASDNSETVTGDGWVSTLNVTAGQIYFLQVNHWNPPTAGYTLNWNLTSGASLNCTPLSVELQDFQCAQDERNMVLKWTTLMERNSDWFYLEKSVDGVNYYPMVQTKAQGNTSEPTEYYVVDNQPIVGTNYYRLVEVDINGQRNVFDASACDFSLNHLIVKEVNIYSMGGQLLATAKGQNIDVKSVFSDKALPDGVYILETIDLNNQVERVKFVQLKHE